MGGHVQVQFPVWDIYVTSHPGQQTQPGHPFVVVSHSSSTLVSINEVNLHQGRLVLGWIGFSKV